jgi:hypothetical protein
MQSSSEALPPSALILCVELYWLVVPAAMLKMSKTLAPSKILAPAENSLIFTKLQQSMSLLTGVLLKSGKHTNAHHQI